MSGKRSALVLSGGGAYAAYEVGVIKALLAGRSPSTAYRPLRPSIVTGTSAGAFNAAFLVAWQECHAERMGELLESAWLEVIADQRDGCGNGVFRYRADPAEYFCTWLQGRAPLRTLERFFDDVATLTAKGLHLAAWVLGQRDVSLIRRLIETIDISAFVSTEPLAHTLRETIDFEICHHSAITLRLALTSWTTGTLAIATNRDLTPEHGPALVRGSASLPGLFPPVRLGSNFFVDGGVTMNTPLAPAVEAGADVLHVVGTFPVPASFNVTPSSVVNFISAELMAFNALLTSEAKRYRYARLVTHNYYPRTHLTTTPLDILNFDRDTLERFIRRGYQDTVEHDCAANGCRVASGGDPRGPVPRLRENHAWSR